MQAARWQAKPKAARVLDITMATAPQRDGAPDLRAVAKSIQTNSAINETVRHAAINLLMHRAQQIRSKAEALKKESAEAQEDAAEPKDEATSQPRGDVEQSPTHFRDAAADERATTQPTTQPTASQPVIVDDDDD